MDSELMDLVREIAQSTAEEMRAQLLTPGGRINYFRAAETLLYNYKSLALLVADRSAYLAAEPVERSAGIVLNAGAGAALSLDERISEREEERIRSYERTAAQFDQVDRVVQLFNDRESFVVIRMYYFGENERGQDRGVDAPRMTWEEMGGLLGRDPKTLRRWRNRLVRDMSVCWFGVAAAVGSAVVTEGQATAGGLLPAA